MGSFPPLSEDFSQSLKACHSRSSISCQFSLTQLFLSRHTQLIIICVPSAPKVIFPLLSPQKDTHTHRIYSQLRGLSRAQSSTSALTHSLEFPHRPVILSSYTSHLFKRKTLRNSRFLCFLLPEHTLFIPDRLPWLPSHHFSPLPMFFGHGLPATSRTGPGHALPDPRAGSRVFPLRAARPLPAGLAPRGAGSPVGHVQEEGAAGRVELEAE